MIMKFLKVKIHEAKATILYTLTRKQVPLNQIGLLLSRYMLQNKISIAPPFPFLPRLMGRGKCYSEGVQRNTPRGPIEGRRGCST